MASTSAAVAQTPGELTQDNVKTVKFPNAFSEIVHVSNVFFACLDERICNVLQSAGRALF